MTRRKNGPELISKDFFAYQAEEETLPEDVAFKGIEIEEESSLEGFHDLYLQRGGIEFMIPIVFEDGMDFEECELYYASMKSQDTGGSFRGLGLVERRRNRREFTNQLRSPEPCLRIPKQSFNTKNGFERKVRRCSFGGLPKLDRPYDRPFLMKASSSRSIADHKPTVAFEEYVQVITIHSIDDLPFDVRSQMWMSRQEMLQGVRGAAEERRQQISLRIESDKAQRGGVKQSFLDGPEADSVRNAPIEVQ